MPKLTKLALKAGVVALVLWGGHKWMNQTPERAETAATTTITVVEKTLDSTEILLDKSGEAVDDAMVVVSDAWERADLKGEIDNIQDDVKPYGKAIKKTVDPNKIPVLKSVGWLNSKTSMAAILLLLVAGSMLYLMVFAGPSSLSGGRD